MHDIVQEVVLTAINADSIQTSCLRFKELSQSEKRHDIQQLLVNCLRYVKSHPDCNQEIRDVIRILIQDNTCWIHWRTKCLALLICTELHMDSQEMNSFYRFLNGCIYSAIILDDHEEVWICLFQLIEQLDKRKGVDWIDCMRSVEENRQMSRPFISTWLKSFTFSVHHFKECLTVCIETPKESLHYDQQIHYCLHILEGVGISMDLNASVCWDRYRSVWGRWFSTFTSC